ncbi:MAG: hypothetical protein EXR86_12375 [Gammaproteobacteria bacterium]|nr:hypothetical protein [Gammaproteobacteria bacterium]
MESLKETPNDNKGLVTYQSRDGQEIKLSFETVRKFLVSGKPEFVTDQEIVLYMGTLKARGLNPFKKDCYLVKYTPNDPAATIVSIDYFRARAKAQPDCVGWQSGVIAKSAAGVIEYRKGSFMFEGDELLGGWFRAQPRGWAEEYEWSVNLSPFIKKTREGQPTQFWNQDRQPQQIAKIAESQGLRRLWPDEFQALYLAEDQYATDVSPAPEPIKMPQAIGKPEPKPAAAAPSGETGGADVPAEDPEAETGMSHLESALAWVADAADAEIMDPARLTACLKGLSQKEQLEVCRAFNVRKKLTTDSLKSVGLLPRGVIANADV